MSGRDDEGPPSPQETEGAGGKVIPMQGRRRSGAAKRVRANLASIERARGAGVADDSLLARLEAWDLDTDVTNLSVKIEAGRDDLRRLRNSLRNWRAVRSHMRGDKAAASAEWAELIEQGFWEALTRRAPLLKADGELAAALADYDSAAKLAPKEGSIYFERGVFYYLHLKEKERAIADLERAAQLLPRDPAPYDWMAKVMSALGNKDGAIRAYGRALKRAPRRADLYLQRGQLWWLKGADEEAISDLDRSIQLDPTKYSAFHTRSFCHQRRGDLPSAIADLSSAIALKPTEAAFFTSRGEAHHKMGAYKAAIADFESALDLRKGRGAKLYRSLGAAHLALGDEESAAGAYTIAFEDDPRLLRELRQSALINRKLDKRKELRADLNILLLVDPREIHVLMARARLSEKEGDIEGAFADIDRAMAVLPRWTDPFVERARIHAKLGRYDLAVEDTSRAVELSPHLPVHLAARALYRVHIDGDTPDARGDLNRAVEMAHYDLDIREARVKYFKIVGKPGEAIADYDMLIMIDSEEPRHYVDRAAARSQEDLESLRLAQADLDKAIALYKQRMSDIAEGCAVRSRPDDDEEPMFFDDYEDEELYDDQMDD